MQLYCVNGTVCGHAAYASLEAGEHHLYHNGTLAHIGVATYGLIIHMAILVACNSLPYNVCGACIKLLYITK